MVPVARAKFKLLSLGSDGPAVVGNMARFYLAELLPRSVERALWLDTDLLVRIPIFIIVGLTRHISSVLLLICIVLHV